jgi:hypothetical protein
MTIRFPLLAAALGAASLAGPAHAQSDAEFLFLSPMGEPFRGTREAPPEAAWYDGTDANHDGKLSPAEMVKDAERFFKLLDMDASGEIDPREMERYELVLVPEVSGGGAAARVHDSQVDGEVLAGGLTGGARYRARGGATSFSYLGMPQPVIAADTNFNRGVSAREFERAAEQRFQLLDLNGDRTIEREELPRPPRRKAAKR